MDGRLFRDAMGKFATGITIVAIREEEEVRAMTVNAFMSISLEPKLIAISIDKRASMHNRFELSSKFGISILADDQKELSMIFAKQMEKDRHVPFTTLDGAPVINNSLTTLSCQVNDRIDAGDHTIVLAEVHALNLKDGDPLVFYEGNYRGILPN
ncbi:flavin reductase family protein [Ornithinibacillus salinisoli]|uniref:Flavin reductase family protein n=1 Tax=Ornithinibacillus salinisoli TaxID=1848459 RepID=A0ABW4W4I3_9BACI